MKEFLVWLVGITIFVLFVIVFLVFHFFSDWMALADPSEVPQHIHSKR